MRGAQQCFMFIAGHKVASCSSATTRRDALEMSLVLLPLLQNTLGVLTTCFASMQLNNRVQCLPLLGIIDLLHIHHFRITALLKRSRRIQDIGYPRRHTSSKVLTSFA